MHRWLFVCVLVGLSVVAALAGTAPSAAQDSYVPVVEWYDCPFPLPDSETEQVTIDCGYLIAPENRADPDGAEVELAIAILYSPSSDPAPDPVVYLEGGPGGSALSGVDYWYDSPLRADRDIVLIDQRGTGYSYPRLYCWELDELDWDNLSGDDADALSNEEREALQECTSRLVREEGVDLGAYTSADAAADVADLRVALEYDEINLLGISYGTRLALTVMRDHPEGVRSVVLDSTYPPVVDAYEEDPANGYRAFRQLFDDCAADATCNSAYPNLEARFLQIVAQWDAAPVYIDDYWSEMTGDDLIGTFYELFYDTNAIPYLPLVISDLEQGDYDSLIDLYDGYLPGDDTEEIDIDEDPVWDFVDEFYWLTDELDDDPYYALWDELDYEWEIGDWDAFRELILDTFQADDADYLLELLDELEADQLDMLADELLWEDVSDTDGLYNSVECNEEIPFNSTSDAEAVIASVPEAYRAESLDYFQVQLETCEIWQAGTASAVEDEAVYSDIPTLVIAGEYDPVTPPSWGRLAADTLSNSTFLEFPGVGHSVIDGGDCPSGIIRAFIDAPAAPLDASCITSMTGPVFVLP